jgi:hypothetical protein
MLLVRALRGTKSGDVVFDVFAYVAGCEVVEVEPKWHRRGGCVSGVENCIRRDGASRWRGQGRRKEGETY